MQAFLLVYFAFFFFFFQVIALRRDIGNLTNSETESQQLMDILKIQFLNFKDKLIYRRIVCQVYWIDEGNVSKFLKLTYSVLLSKLFILQVAQDPGFMRLKPASHNSWSV